MKTSKQVYYFLTKSEKKILLNNPLPVYCLLNLKNINLNLWLAFGFDVFLLNTQWLGSRILYKLFQASQMSWRFSP